MIGIEDCARGGEVLFSVQLCKGAREWKSAFQSGAIRKITAPQPMSVELGAADEIRLYTDANGTINCDHAVFGVARLEP